LATEKEWQELLGRALADEAFRAQLFDDPRQAAREAGYDLTEEQLAALKTIDIQSLAEALDERLVKKIGFTGL
jgi:nucleoid-associated protein YejK